MSKLNLSRRELFASASAALAASMTLSTAARANVTAGPANFDFKFEVTRSEEEWRAMLTDAEYRILREGGTEVPKTSPLWEETRAGTYHCRGCGLPVYDAEWKKVLDKGWLFFYHSMPHAAMMSVDGVEERYIDGEDFAILSAIEVHCRRCGSHLGHILIVDGQLLHCINGTSLVFEPNKV
ncbi:MAG: peptide-methionine (R)-S-oxide reductase [Pseudomonadota bacterium]